MVIPSFVEEEQSLADPGWLPDPTGRAAWRWWDGTDWSRFSADYLPTDPPAEYRTLNRSADLRLKDSDRPHPLRNPRPPAKSPTEVASVA
jgi:hypothetical protein